MKFSVITVIFFIKALSAYAIQLDVSYSTRFDAYNTTDCFWVENRYPVNLTCSFSGESNEKVYILEWFISGRMEYQWIVPSVSEFFNDWKDFTWSIDDFNYIQLNNSIYGSSIVTAIAFATEKVDYVCALVFKDSDNIVRTTYKVIEFGKCPIAHDRNLIYMCVDWFCLSIFQRRTISTTRRAGFSRKQAPTD